MRLASPLLAALALSACASLAVPAPNPERISLLSDRLTVHFTDGTRCTADVAAAPSGNLAGCAVAMDYDVAVHHPIWVPGAEAMMEPYATVTLTRRADGRRFTWQTPRGGDLHPAPNYGSL